MTPKTKKKIEQIQNCETPNSYKLTDAGILPNDWNYAKLSDISEQITQTAGTEKYETVSISAGIGFVNQAKKFGKELSGKQYAKYTVLHKGDYSYNKGNSKKYPQGCVYRLKDRETAAVPNVFESFRITTGCAEYYDQLFVSGYLNHQLYRLINHGVRDDGLLNLTHKDFYSCWLPVPPLSEQEKIAKILSTQDKVIECYEKKIEQLRLMKKYYLQNMFPNRGETVPKIRFKGFTDAWEQRKISELGKIVTGSTPPTTKSEYYSDDGFPWVTPTDIESNTISDSPRKLSDEGAKVARVVPANTILCTCIASIGKNTLLTVKGSFNQQINGLTPYEDNNSYFLLTESEIWSNHMKQMAASGTMQIVNKTEFSEMLTMIPKYEEQKQIGDYFRTLDHLITLHQRSCKEEKKKKKALQQLLLTGIIRTNEL